MINIKIITVIMFGSSFAYAQQPIDMAFRRANAIALYEFLETSGNTIYDTSQLGSPLNLTITDNTATSIGHSVVNGLGTLDIKSRNLIQSTGAAIKIIDACKASGELTIETWIEDAEPVQKLVGEYPDGTQQPNRIVSLNTDIKRNNFYMGQFYDNGELIYSAVNTSGNESSAGNADITKAGGSLNNPIISGKTQIIIPSLETIALPAAAKIQKILMTLTKDSVASFYHTDREGNMSRGVTTAKGFTAAGGQPLFNNWYTNSKLSIGNVSSTATEVLNAPADFTKCTGVTADNDPTCRANSRYWKGKLHLVAIYCKALTATQILGSIANAQLPNAVMSMGTSLQITDNLLKAQDIFDRLTGVKAPLYDPKLKDMELLLNVNDRLGAADLAASDPRFLNITVRNFAAKMSTRAETVDVPLNDFTATVIGAVRDGLNAQRLLWDDITYAGDPTKVAVPNAMIADILKSNNHYDSLEVQRADLANVLMRKTQNIFNGTTSEPMPIGHTAGLLTSRAWMAAHAIAGTNRRPVEFALRQFLCTPLEKAADNSGPDNVIARDIDRFPGGIHSKYTVSCRSCHTIQDGLRPAFAYFTFNAGYTMHSFTSPAVTKQTDEDKGLGIFLSTDVGATFVHDKLNHNQTVFPGGRITVDDNWVNNANFGSNAPYFNWTRLKGKGITEFGKMISESKQFPICMANRVYSQVCKREPTINEISMLNTAATQFSTQRNYNLKFLFEYIVTSKECLGGN